MLKSNPSYLGIAGKNPALGPPKSALGLRPWADFGGPRAGFFPEFLGQGLDFLPERISHQTPPIQYITHITLPIARIALSFMIGATRGCMVGCNWSPIPTYEQLFFCEASLLECQNCR